MCDKSQFPQGPGPHGVLNFQAVLESAALVLTLLLLVEGKAMFVDRKRSAGQKGVKETDWIPDRLAKLGAKNCESTFQVQHKIPISCRPFLLWEHAVWEGSLLTSVAVRLENPENARATLAAHGFPFAGGR